MDRDGMVLWGALAGIVPAMAAGWLAVHMYPFFRVRFADTLAFVAAAGIGGAAAVAVALALAYGVGSLGAPPGVHVGALVSQMAKSGIMGGIVGAVGYLGWSIRKGRFEPKGPR